MNPSDGANKTTAHTTNPDVTDSDYVELVLSRKDAMPTMTLAILERHYENEKAITEALRWFLVKMPRVRVPILIMDSATVDDVIAAEKLLRRAGVKNISVQGYYKAPMPEVPKPPFQRMKEETTASVLTESQALTLAKQEFVKQGYKVEAYLVEIAGRPTNGFWWIYFYHNVRCRTPGCDHHVYVDKVTGQAKFVAGD